MAAGYGTARRWLVTAACGLTCVLPWSASHASKSQVRALEDLPRIDVHEMTLGNGLRVVVVPEHTTPAVAVCVTYRVGSRDERPGRTGLAHLVEHMMFQGSENVGKGEHFVLVQNNGGRANGTTSLDYTSFFELLPKNQLELALFLEADRMRALALDPINLANQRRVVQEERRRFIDAKPYGKSYLAVDALSFESFAYRHPVIGYADDVAALSVEDVDDFIRRHYAPNNAVLTITGDVEPRTARKLVRKHFETIRARPVPARVDLPEPERTAPKRTVIEDPLARLPQLLVAHPIAPGNTPEHNAMSLLSVILGTGRNSRLSRALMAERGDATTVEVSVDSRAGPSQFYVLATPTPGVPVDALEGVVERELQRVIDEGVTTSELTSAVEHMRRMLARQRQSLLALATDLGALVVNFGDPELVNSQLTRYRSVTAAQIRHAAAKYLVPRRKTTVVTLADRVGEVAAESPEDAPISEPHDKGMPLKTVRRLNRAPLDKRPLQLRLQRPAVRRLANGMRVAVLERRSAPVVDLAMWIGPGVPGDPEHLPGLAAMTAAMLPESAAQRSGREIAAELEGAGATLDTEATPGSTYTAITVSGEPRHMETLIGVVSDVVLRPDFRPSDLQRLKRQKAGELMELRSQPDFLASERLHRAVYGARPQGAISPTPESLLRVTTADLETFHMLHYRPNNAVLGVIGDVRAEDVFRAVEQWFGVWEARSATAPVTESTFQPPRKRVLLVDRPGSSATIVVGTLSIRRSDPDLFPLWVMNRILGAPTTGRLSVALREEKGYTYSTYSSFTAETFPGVWSAALTVGGEMVGPALADFLSEVRRMREEPIPATELDENRRAVSARFALSLEQPRDYLEKWLEVLHYGLPEHFWDEFPQRIAAVDAKAVARVAREYLDPDNLVIVCVGDARRLMGALGRLGTVERHTAERAPLR